MKKLLVLLAQLILTTNYALAQCGVHKQVETQTRARSTVTVPEGIKEKDLKTLATISKKEAKKIGTSQYDGKVKKIKLITEDGTLVWKLEVKGNEGQKEIFIDPVSGTFLGYGLTK